MNPDRIYSADSSTWLQSWQIVFQLAFGSESSVTRSPIKIDELIIREPIRTFPDTMIASEKALSKDWDSPEEDAAWSGL